MNAPARQQQPEPDFFVTHMLGDSKMWLKREIGDKPEDWRWTPMKKRALRYGSKPLADAAASEFNKYASTPAVVEQE